MQKAAWLLFLACGIIYTTAAIRDRDILLIAGSIFFVAAVILFLIPERKAKGD